MGFTVTYRSTKQVPPETADAIEAAADQACEGRTWLSCEPVCFFSRDVDGTLWGGSKPNFQPHPDDVAAAASEDLPDGTIRDVLDILCQLSREHSVDWSIGHDHDPHIGFIRGGLCDDEVLAQIEAFADLSDMLSDMLGEMGFDEENW